MSLKEWSLCCPVDALSVYMNPVDIPDKIKLKSIPPVSIIRGPSNIGVDTINLTDIDYRKFDQQIDKWHFVDCFFSQNFESVCVHTVEKICEKDAKKCIFSDQMEFFDYDLENPKLRLIGKLKQFN